MRFPSIFSMTAPEYSLMKDETLEKILRKTRKERKTQIFPGST